MTEGQRELVELGNRLAAFTALVCEELHLMGAYFSVENPARSWLWLFPDMQRVEAMCGVAFAHVFYSDFGTCYRKPTAVLHNTPTLHALRPERAKGVVTAQLRGRVWWNGELVFRTALASMYPPDFGVAYGRLMAEALTMRASALENGDVVPMASRQLDCGMPVDGAEALAEWAVWFRLEQGPVYSGFIEPAS